MVLVYKEKLCRYYSAPGLSAPLLFVVFVHICTVCVAFSLVYFSRSFWIKDGSYREQPEVKFGYDVFLVAESAAHPGEPVIATTFSPVQQLGMKGIVLPYVTVREEDHNHDGLTDLFEIQVQVPNEDAVVSRATLLLFFEYRLHQRVRLDMSAMTFTDASTAVPASALYIEGTLALHQRTPLRPSNNGEVRTVYKDPILPRSGTLSPQEIEIRHILKRYTSRNETIRIDPLNIYWTSASNSALPPRPLTGDNGLGFSVTTRIHVDEQRVRFVPTAPEVLKYAWVQFFSVYSVLFVVVHLGLNKLVFRSHLFQTHITTDMIKPKRF